MRSMLTSSGSLLAWSLAGLVAVTGSAQSQTPTFNRWLPLGPDGGPVRAVVAASNGRTVYAGTPGGQVYRSLNRGRSWTAASQGLRGALLSLHNAPQRDPGTVYAVTTQGVFGTVDAAQTWTARNGRGASGLPAGNDLLSLDVAPSAPAVLYVVVRTRPSLDLPLLNRVYRSADGGASWSRVHNGLPDTVHNEVFDLAVDPARPQVAFAATSRGVFRTADGGSRWVASGLAGQRVIGVTVDLVRPTLLYARVEPISGPGRIWTSENGGQSWTVRSDGFSGFALRPHPTQAGTAYLLSFAGPIRQTTDGGRTWNRIDDGILHRWVDLALDPLRPGGLYGADFAAGTDPGLFASTDDGGSWQPAAAGIVATAVTALSPDHESPGRLVVAFEEDGLQRLDLSAPAALRWTQVEFDRRRVLALTRDLLAPATLFAAVDSDSRVFRSLDNGASWQDLESPPSSTRFSMTVVNGDLWTGGGWVWQAATGSWQQRFSPESRQVASAGLGPAKHIWWNDTSFLDAAGGQDQIWKSPDAGSSAARVPVGPEGETTEILPNPQNPNRVSIAFTGPVLGQTKTGGVYRSVDGGASWRLRPVAPEAPPVFSLAFDPLDQRHLIAGSLGRAFESRDGGLTWSELSAGLPSGATVADLAFDSAGELYAATSGGGVFRLERLGLP